MRAIPETNSPASQHAALLCGKNSETSLPLPNSKVGHLCPGPARSACAFWRATHGGSLDPDRTGLSPADLHHPVFTYPRTHHLRCGIPRVRTGRHGSISALSQYRTSTDGQPAGKSLAICLQADQATRHLYSSRAGGNLHQRYGLRNSGLRFCLVRLRHVRTQPPPMGCHAGARTAVFIWAWHAAGATTAWPRVGVRAPRARCAPARPRPCGS